MTNPDDSEADDMTWRVVADLDRCEGSALCIALAPPVFGLGDDEVVSILWAEPSDDLRTAVDNAVGLCPTGALRLVEGPKSSPTP
jgi:ferredoxin